VLRVAEHVQQLQSQVAQQEQEHARLEREAEQNRQGIRRLASDVEQWEAQSQQEQLDPNVLQRLHSQQSALPDKLTGLLCRWRQESAACGGLVLFAADCAPALARLALT
jgi:phage shock protein A